MTPDRRRSVAQGGSDEMRALIDSLHRTGERLEELTGGEVDAVADGGGNSFLLRRAQDRLRRSVAEQQEAIINALPASVALLDVHGVIVSVNEGWRTFGRENGLQAAGHAVGVDYLAVCDSARGDDKAIAARVAAGIRSILGGESASFAVEYSCHSPHVRRWILLKVTPLAGAKPSGAVVMHVDVSAQRRSEESHRASELRFRQMAESIRDVFFLLDVASEKVLYVSPAYEAISGRACRDLYDDPHAWYDAVHPDDRAGALAAATLGRTHAQEYSYEARFGRTDGSMRWMAVRGFPVRDEDGGVTRMAGVAIDITEPKRQQEELERTHQRLLEVSRQAGMAEVATNMLHNVGNVLNSVNVSASLALENVLASRAGGLDKVVALIDEHRGDLGSYITADPKGRHIPDLLEQIAASWAEQQRALAAELVTLRSSVDHIKRIVEMQQGYAKVSGVAEVIDVRDLVEDGLRMNADELVATGVQIVRRFEEVAPILAEKHKVLQILVNLVRNARQACEGAPSDGRRITVGVSESEGRIRIRVADTGTGIAPGNLARIFSHGFTTRKDGHGFGLHSGALTAGELGGSLSAASEGAGQGARFTLELPATRPAPAHD